MNLIASGTCTTPEATIKDETRGLADLLPDYATWEDLRHQIDVHQAIESGVKDSREGRTVSLADPRKGLSL